MKPSEHFGSFKNIIEKLDDNSYKPGRIKVVFDIGGYTLESRGSKVRRFYFSPQDADDLIKFVDDLVMDCTVWGECGHICFLGKVQYRLHEILDDHEITFLQQLVTPKKKSRA